VRRSAVSETAWLLKELVESETRAIAFCRSRRAAELVAEFCRRELPGALRSRVKAYRAGYLPEERRELERGLAAGELLGVASTSALELGIDIGSLDAALVAGYPGTRASLWQQAGRAGRRGSRSLRPSRDERPSSSSRTLRDAPRSSSLRAAARARARGRHDLAVNRHATSGQE